MCLTTRANRSPTSRPLGYWPNLRAVLLLRSHPRQNLPWLAALPDRASPPEEAVSIGFQTPIACLADRGSVQSSFYDGFSR